MLRVDPERLKAFAADLVRRLRRPRGVAYAVAALPLFAVLYVLVLVPFTPGIGDIRKAKSERPARVLSVDGKELAVFKRSNREWVSLDSVSPLVIAALVATEDHRFYEHHGIDWRRTAAAALNTFSGDRQGGSTLTQQLARNLYPEEIGRAPTLTRKIKEAITALKIEATYTKQEILETYLNTVPFLYNAYGIEMAARTYFDTSAGALDVLQSATLIGMLKGNAYYNPVLNPERALPRRNTVLAQMVKRGALDAAKFEALKKKPLRLDFERQVEPPGSAAHFAQQLRKWAIAWADRNDYDLYGDALVIRTTIDSRLQALANQAVARQGGQLQAIADAGWGVRAGKSANQVVEAFVRETPEYRAALADGLTPVQAMKKLLADAPFMRALRRDKTQVQAGFIALDPANRQVRAWVGSRDYAQDAYDHVQQARRQPGSTFKPFVYGAAFAQGAHADDTLVDEAVDIPLAGGEVWRPTDHTPPSGRAMSLRDGLAYSKNTITAQLMQRVGAAKVAKLAQAMGVRQSALELVPSLALGTSPVTLKEMVSAYATIANGGDYIEPAWVTRIEDGQGRVLEEFAPAPSERALSRSVAYTLLDTLRTAVDRGTGIGIRTRFGIRADVAGKTGTTQDNADGWFILMHPQLVAGAWVGFNDSRITLRSDYWGQGAHSALPMVGEVFQQALRAKVIDGKQRFIDEEESNWVGTAVAGVRNWVYDLFGRRTGGPEGPERTTGALPVPGTAPAEAERPEITEAPLVPLENAMPRVPPLPPVTYDEEPEATSPEMAPVPQPGVVITLPPPLQSQPQSGIVVTTPVQRGVVVPAPVPAQGNVPIWVESRP